MIRDSAALINKDMARKKKNKLNSYSTFFFKEKDSPRSVTVYSIHVRIEFKYFLD